MSPLNLPNVAVLLCGSLDSCCSSASGVPWSCFFRKIKYKLALVLRHSSHLFLSLLYNVIYNKLVKLLHLGFLGCSGALASGVCSEWGACLATVEGSFLFSDFFNSVTLNCRVFLSLLSSKYSEHKTLESFGWLADSCATGWIAGILLIALHHYKDIVKLTGSILKVNSFFFFSSFHRLINQWTLFQLCFRSLCLSNWIYQWDRQASFQFFFSMYLL